MILEGERSLMGNMTVSESNVCRVIIVRERLVSRRERVHSPLSTCARIRYIVKGVLSRLYIV